MRIGTWNLEGKWSPDHLAVLVGAECDVWLLTEVRRDVAVPGLDARSFSVAVEDGKAWAGVLARSGDALPSPHGASALLRAGTTTFCSSVLPWRGSGGGDLWPGEGHAERTRHVVDALRGALPHADLVWGGDWNHSLQGPEWAGSRQGRDLISAALTELGLVAPTATLSHRLPGVFSIDHVATASPVREARVVPVVRRLSDHDAYVVEV